MKRLFRQFPLLSFLFTIFAIVLSVFAVYHWFSGGTIFYYWDANLPMDTRISLQTFFYPWYSNKFPGLSGSGWSWLPYWVAISGFKTLLGSLSNAQFGLYVMLLTVSITGFFVLIRHLRTIVFGKNDSCITMHLIPIAISVCYTFNLYTFYYAYYMFNPQMFTIALLPWSFLAITRLFPLNTIVDEGKKNPSVWWIAFYFVTQLLMIPGFTTYVFLGQYLAFLLFYFSLFWYVASRNREYGKIFPLFLLIILTLALHWIWFYPSLLGFKELYESQRSFGVMEYLASGSVNTHLLNLFRLIGSAMMNNNPFSWDWIYTSQSIIAFPLFIFPFAILYLFWKLKDISNRLFILFFGTVLVISLFIMKLMNPPFSWITRLLFEYVPFFGAFRDSVQKGGLYFLLAYFLLIALGLEALWLSIKRKWFITAGASVVFFAGILLMTGPFFLFSYDNIKKIPFYFKNNKYTLNAKTIIPKEYIDLKNNLETICKGNVTLVIPRTSAISSAVWQKYGYSYVGQDYLLNLIDCNFISTHLIQTKPDAFITAPYLMVQDGNFEDFKKFLIQNSINILLIRKDYIPYYFTHWANVDPTTVSQFLSTDNDFFKQYENDFFILYILRKTGQSAYGFSLTSTMVYTNAKLSTASDFKILYSMIPEYISPVIIYKNDQLTKYQSSVNAFLSKPNCVGCVKISQQFLTDLNELKRIVSKTKALIKQVIKKTDNRETEDIKLSHEIIKLNTTFFLLLDMLDKEDIKQIQLVMEAYTNELEMYWSRIERYNSGYFEKNNKYIETRNFISAQNQQLYSYLQNHIITNTNLNRQLNLLLSFQNIFLTSLATKIWETDEKMSRFNMRLDIPSTGEYSCSLALNDGFTAKTLLTNFEEQPLKIDKQSTSFTHFFEKGSYPLIFQYDSNIHQAIEIPNTNNRIMKQYDLGILNNGTYSIQMVTQSLQNKPLGIVITTGQLDLISLGKIGTQEAVRDDIQLFDIYPTEAQKLQVPYTREFAINALEPKKYYVYVFTVHMADQENNYQIKSINIRHALKDQDVAMGCFRANPDALQSAVSPTVEQNGHMSYKMTIPTNIQPKYLLFNQSYDPDWRAYVIQNGTRMYLEQIQSGYANAWILPVERKDTIYVEFNRLTRMNANALLSMCAFLFVLMCFIKIYTKKYE